jgi:hypothetical protein
LRVLLFGAAPSIAVILTQSRIVGFQSARISSVREFIAFRTLASIVCT